MAPGILIIGTAPFLFKLWENQGRSPRPVCFHQCCPGQSFACTHLYPLWQESLGKPQPEAPLQGSHPHPQPGTVIDLFLPSGVESDKLQSGWKWGDDPASAAWYSRGAGSPHPTVVPSHWPTLWGPEASGRAPSPGNCFRSPLWGTCCNPPWA